MHRVLISQPIHQHIEKSQLAKRPVPFGWCTASVFCSGVVDGARKRMAVRLQFLSLTELLLLVATPWPSISHTSWFVVLRS